MHEAEGINFSVNVPKEKEGGQKRIKPAGGFRHNNPSLEDVIRFIEGLPLTKSDKEYLSSAARKVPHGALFNFRKNYIHYLKKEGRR